MNHRFLFLALLGGSALSATAETITSPDGSLTAEVSVSGTRLSYTLNLGTTPVVESSPLGFTLNGVDLGDQVTVLSASDDDGDESFPSRHGMHATARGHYHGRRLSVRHNATGAVYVLSFRAYDSGIAFRYELTGTGPKNVTSETSTFILPAGTKVWSQPGRDVYENPYGGADIAAIAAGTVMGPPAVGKLPGGAGYVALTESAPGPGFPNPFLTKIAGGTNRSLQVTYPKNQDATTGASTGADIFTPWNVVMAGANLNVIANSDIVESLAPAPDPALFPEGAATAWAQPGRSVWDWMSRFPGGITAENSKLDAYWANQLGWEMITVDEGWGNWNNGDPWAQVADLCAYAKTLNIKVLLWIRSENLQSQAQRTDFFTRLKNAGAGGFKADFFDFRSTSPAAKERVTLISTIAKEAAGYQLVADFHGTGKPLGQFRTYPNLLNFEAVYGKEQYPGAGVAVYAPLTRFFAGPADYTPLGLEGTLRGAQTRAFEIASAVNMAGPLLTLAERSDTMAKSPFTPVIRGIPNLWDETKVLPASEVGDSCAMVRRKGTTWYVGVMNANAQRTWTLPLDFLTPGTTYQAEIVRDDSTVLETRTVTSADTLTATTSSAGGFVAKLSLPVQTSSIRTLPFSTSFDPGRGSIYAEKGQLISSTSWADRLLAEPLPALRWQITGPGALLTPSLDETDAYQGGASLKVAGALSAPNDLALFPADLTLTAATKLGLAFKRGAAGASGLQVGLTFADAPTTPVYLDAGNAATAGWNEISLALGDYAGRKLSAVSLRFTSAAAIADYHLNVGRLALYELPLAVPGTPGGFHAEQVNVLGLDTFSAALKWSAPVGGAAAVNYYSVTQLNPLTNQRRWIGVTAGTSLALSSATRIGEETSAVFELTAVGAGGLAVSPKLQATISLPARPLLTNPLSGTVTGTTGSFENSSNTRDKVYDGDVTTYFDANSSDGVWAGLDLGAGKSSKVVALRYYPRDSWSQRMTGGLFQGANQANFSDAVTLATVTAQPVEGTYTLVAVTATQSFRYLRYLSPNGGWGNVAEVQFFGPAKPGAPAGVKAGRAGASAKVEWQPVAGATGYNVKRATSAAGDYVSVASGVTGLSFMDANLDPGSAYFYIVSATGTEGEGDGSAAVEATDGYAEWAQAQGLGSAFDGDANGNGLADGLEYAVPGGLAVGADAGISAEVRDDVFLSLLLQRSVDLQIWTAVDLDEEVAQDGVMDGFRRIAFHEDAEQRAALEFFRLQVSR